MKKPVIIIGDGGHANVVADVLQLSGHKIIGVTGVNAQGTSQIAPYLGNDDTITNYKTNEIMLVNGIGSIADCSKRARVFNYFTSMGYHFTKLIHPSAIVAKNCSVEDGAQVMAGAIVQPNTFIGSNSIINSGAIVEHDCKIDKDCHISSGAVLCGGVNIGQGSHVGAGSTIIQNITIGEYSVVGAGSAVIKDVLKGSVVVGNPAKVIRVNK